MNENTRQCFVVVLVLTALTAMGCGSKFPAVTGKVSANGQPVAQLRVMFVPLAVGNNHTPGPYSLGVTDANGKFSLKTRQGDLGAVAGPHQVGFEWADIEFDEMASLKKSLKAATGKTSDLEDGVAATSASDIQKKIDDLKQKKANRPKVNFKLVFDFEVPAAGTDSADFEIGK